MGVSNSSKYQWKTSQNSEKLLKVMMESWLWITFQNLILKNLSSDLQFIYISKFIINRLYFRGSGLGPGKQVNTLNLYIHMYIINTIYVNACLQSCDIWYRHLNRRSLSSAIWTTWFYFAYAAFYNILWEAYSKHMLKKQMDIWPSVFFFYRIWFCLDICISKFKLIILLELKH